MGSGVREPEILKNRNTFKITPSFFNPAVRRREAGLESSFEVPKQNIKAKPVAKQRDGGCNGSIIENSLN